MTHPLGGFADAAGAARSPVVQKLDLETRAELMLLALSTGLIGPGS